MKFMLWPDKTPPALAGELVDIYDFPDGRLKIRWKGLPLLSIARLNMARSRVRPSI
jgi:hypothetical protein